MRLRDPGRSTATDKAWRVLPRVGRNCAPPASLAAERTQQVGRVSPRAAHPLDPDPHHRPVKAAGISGALLCPQKNLAGPTRPLRGSSGINPSSQVRPIYMTEWPGFLFVAALRGRLRERCCDGLPNCNSAMRGGIGPAASLMGAAWRSIGIAVRARMGQWRQSRASFGRGLALEFRRSC
jgi:hypothetical protein